MHRCTIRFASNVSPVSQKPLPPIPKSITALIRFHAGERQFVSSRFGRPKPHWNIPTNSSIIRPNRFGPSGLSSGPMREEGGNIVRKRLDAANDFWKIKSRSRNWDRAKVPAPVGCRAGVHKIRWGNRQDVREYRCPFCEVAGGLDREPLTGDPAHSYLQAIARRDTRIADENRRTNCNGESPGTGMTTEVAGNRRHRIGADRK